MVGSTRGVDIARELLAVQVSYKARIIARKKADRADKGIRNIEKVKSLVQETVEKFPQIFSDKLQQALDRQKVFWENDDFSLQHKEDVVRIPILELPYNAALSQEDEDAQLQPLLSVINDHGLTPQIRKRSYGNDTTSGRRTNYGTGVYALIPDEVINADHTLFPTRVL